MPETTIFTGVRVFDGLRFLAEPRDVLVRGERIAEVAAAPVAAPSGAVVIRGGALFPGFVDAHVHLSFSHASLVARGGVTTVIDLGEPEAFAFAEHPPLTVRAAGPLLTAPRGYPTRSWGAGGYGLEVRDPAHARDAVARLADRGAAIVKIAVEPAGGPILDGDALTAIVREAHDRGLAAAVHALGAATVATALDAGTDVLAHVPVEPLPRALVRAIVSRGVAVISTLRAFGASRAARENLHDLARAGCRIVYGTDLGNGDIAPGLDVDELQLIGDAFDSSEKALAAATSVAGAYAKHGGRIEAGAPADLVHVASYSTLEDLRAPRSVWKNGTRLTGDGEAR